MGCEIPAAGRHERKTGSQPSQQGPGHMDKGTIPEPKEQGCGHHHAGTGPCPAPAVPDQGSQQQEDSERDRGNGNIRNPGKRKDRLNRNAQLRQLGSCLGGRPIRIQRRTQAGNQAQHTPCSDEQDCGLHGERSRTPGLAVGDPRRPWCCCRSRRHVARAGRRFGCGARQYRRFGRLPCGDCCRAGHRPGGTVCGQVHRSVEDRLAPARAVGRRGKSQLDNCVREPGPAEQAAHAGVAGSGFGRMGGSIAGLQVPARGRIILFGGPVKTGMQNAVGEGVGACSG